MVQNETSRPGDGPLNSRIGSLALRSVAPGEFHPLDRCCWCGTSVHPLEPIIFKSTLAPAVRCPDAVACAARRRRAA
jgi:hypothetical protein